MLMSGMSSRVQESASRIHGLFKDKKDSEFSAVDKVVVKNAQIDHCDFAKKRQHFLSITGGDF